MKPSFIDFRIALGIAAASFFGFFAKKDIAESPPERPNFATVIAEGLLQIVSTNEFKS